MCRPAILQDQLSSTLGMLSRRVAMCCSLQEESSIRGVIAFVYVLSAISCADIGLSIYLMTFMVVLNFNIGLKGLDLRSINTRLPTRR